MTAIVTKRSSETVFQERAQTAVVLGALGTLVPVLGAALYTVGQVAATFPAFTYAVGYLPLSIAMCILFAVPWYKFWRWLDDKTL